MEDARGADDFGRHLGRRVGRFRAALAIEREVAFAVGGDRHDRERGGALARRQNALCRNPAARERCDQEPAKRVVADLAQHGRAAAEARDADRDIAWRAARLGRQARSSVGAARRHQVDDQFAESGDVIAG